MAKVAWQDDQCTVGVDVRPSTYNEEGSKIQNHSSKNSNYCPVTSNRGQLDAEPHKGLIGDEDSISGSKEEGLW